MTDREIVQELDRLPDSHLIILATELTHPNYVPEGVRFYTDRFFPSTSIHLAAMALGTCLSTVLAKRLVSCSPHIGPDDKAPYMRQLTEFI